MRAAIDRFESALSAHVRVVETRGHDTEFLCISQMAVLAAALMLLVEAKKETA
jgi:hypothetical protein